ncbi:MAG: hypothetical protein GF331_14170 [Chitinivibrionales bacterium]|nr:hypothetical protein [Chitinivibrionales bacterium]
MMNARERFVAALRSEKLDRYPFVPGAPRESTLQRWHSEGLPADIGYMDAIREALGLGAESSQERVWPGIDFRMIPQYEEQVLEHRGGHFVLRDWMGNVVEIADRYDASYLRSARDFVTRRWLRFPVESREQWEQMRRRYDPQAPERLPDDFGHRCMELAQRDYPVGLSVNGPFWQLREWLGFEPLCMRILTDPDLVREMIAFWTDFVDALLHRILDRFQPDWLFISEDMAYKAHSMIDPAQARELLLPSYVRWVSTVKQAGVPVVVMDSDGYIEDLVPIWIDAGIDACNPIEVAAHNDIVHLRQRFGTRMAYWGGIDKRAIAAGGTAIEREVERVCSLLTGGGGLIPSCDHGIPPDVSWPDFLHYADVLARATGWKR